MKEKKGSGMAPRFSFGQLVEYWYQQHEESGKGVRFRERGAEFILKQVSF